MTKEDAMADRPFGAMQRDPGGTYSGAVDSMVLREIGAEIAKADQVNRFHAGQFGDRVEILFSNMRAPAVPGRERFEPGLVYKAAVSMDRRTAQELHDDLAEILARWSDDR
jgi:hypothetical protein